MDQELFYLLGFVSVASALGAVTRRHPVYAGLFLMSFFFSLSGLYALLAAPFVAAMQILVYVGAILVLFVFMIMLLDLKAQERGFGGIVGKRYAGLTAGLIATMVGAVSILGALAIGEGKDWGAVPAGELESFGSIQEIGLAMFSQGDGYVIGVELTSLLLLVAAIGAVFLASPDESDEAVEETSDDSPAPMEAIEV